MAVVLYFIYYKIFLEDKVGETTPSIFLSCDKATNGGFIKIVSWYSKTTQKVEQNILDVDRTYGVSKDCAKVLDSKQRTIAQFQRGSGGLYVASMTLKAPEPFTRQAP